MKKTVAFFTILCFSCLTCFAQEFSVDKLQHGVWQLTTDSPNERTIMSYTDSIEHFSYSECSTGQWLGVSYNKSFYLSNNIPQVFDFSKVGKKESGRYLVSWNDKMNEFDTVEIVLLTKYVLKIKGNNNVVLTYRNED